VLVRDRAGATMPYHLTAYAPWEGYRFMVNGSRGRLELEVVENDHVSPAAAGRLKGGGPSRPDSTTDGRTPGGARPDAGATAGGRTPASAQLHGDAAAAESGWYTLTVRPFWQQPYRVEVPGYTREGHGGADQRMLDVLFGPDSDDGTPDELGRAATERDGAASLLVGLAGNASLASGAPVRCADLLDLTLKEPSASAP